MASDEVARVAARLVLNEGNGTWTASNAKADAVIDAYLAAQGSQVARIRTIYGEGMNGRGEFTDPNATLDRIWEALATE